MMRQYIVGILFLAGLAAQTVECNNLPTVPGINKLAQKLEDHFNGKNLDDKITKTEIDSAIFEFDASYWTDTDVLVQDELRAAREFLSAFLYDYLNKFYENLDEMGDDEEVVRAFSVRLEDNYKRFRPIYRGELSIRESQIADKTRTFIERLLPGNGEKITKETILGAAEEFRDNGDAFIDLPKESNIYENLDRFEKLAGYWFAPEVQTLATSVYSILSRDVLAKLDAGDKSVGEELKEAYQKGLAEFKRTHHFE